MNLFFVHRIKNVIFALVAFLTLTIILANFPAAKNLAAAALSKKELPIYCVDTNKKQIAFTFDAAWGNEDTENLINIFKKHEIKVTFFVTGEWAAKYPESVKQLYDAGHDIMNHSDTHKHMSKLSVEEITDDINRCNEKVSKITSITPVLFRPPYGDYNNTLIKTIRDMKMYTIQWDVDSLDWKDLSPSEINNRVVRKVKNGSIVLFHNGAKNTPSALPTLIEKLKADGYEFVKVSDLIIKGNYKIDHAGKQIANTDTAEKDKKQS